VDLGRAFHPVNLLIGTISVDVILLMAGISPNIMLWVGPFTPSIRPSFTPTSIDPGSVQICTGDAGLPRWHHTGLGRGRNTTLPARSIGTFVWKFRMPANSLPQLRQGRSRNALQIAGQLAFRSGMSRSVLSPRSIHSPIDARLAASGAGSFASFAGSQRSGVEYAFEFPRGGPSDRSQSRSVSCVPASSWRSRDSIGVNVDQAKLSSYYPCRHHRGRKSADRRRHLARTAESSCDRKAMADNFIAMDARRDPGDRLIQVEGPTGPARHRVRGVDR